MVDVMADRHSEALYKYVSRHKTRYSERRKNVLFISSANLLLRMTLNQRRCEVKFYDELKAELKAMQQQMVEAK